jgi:hypothetical protein
VRHLQSIVTATPELDLLAALVASDRDACVQSHRKPALSGTLRSISRIPSSPLRRKVRIVGGCIWHPACVKPKMRPRPDRKQQRSRSRGLPPSAWRSVTPAGYSLSSRSMACVGASRWILSSITIMPGPRPATTAIVCGHWPHPRSGSGLHLRELDHVGTVRRIRVETPASRSGLSCCSHRGAPTVQEEVAVSGL